MIKSLEGRRRNEEENICYCGFVPIFNFLFVEVKLFSFLIISIYKVFLPM